MKALMTAVFLSLFALPALANGEISCTGTEPFWSLTVTGDKMVYSSPEHESSATFRIVSRQEPMGFSAGYMSVIKSKYTTLTIIQGECSDGMSDEIYTHHAVYDKNGTIFGGCCNIPSPSDADAPGESSAIE